jgi:hypothetical protein
MRIYTNKKANNVLNKLEPFFFELRHLSYILSNNVSGSISNSISNEMYQVEHNKIYNVRVSQGKEKTKTLLGAFPITIDYTEYIKEDECYQVPPKCRSEFLVQKIYKPSPSSLVEWVFVYEGEILKENYFYVPGYADINSAQVKADLLWGFCLVA